MKHTPISAEDFLHELKKRNTLQMSSTLDKLAETCHIVWQKESVRANKQVNKGNDEWK